MVEMLTYWLLTKKRQFKFKGEKLALEFTDNILYAASLILMNILSQKILFIYPFNNTFERLFKCVYSIFS
jgi:hypothetical protein